MSRLSSPLAILLAAAVVLLAGCRGRDSEGGGEAGAEAENQGVEGFFAPRKGETWKYKVQKEIPLDVQLSEEDEARRPERTDSGYLFTFERARTCAGTERFEGAEDALTVMDIFEDGVPLGHEVYDIGPQGVFSRGWIGPGDEEQVKFLKEASKLATPDMQPGQTWTVTGSNPDRPFLFRVIERATIKVPAGTFDAARLQVTSERQDGELKRTIWFADNIGIVKEETVRYGPQRTRVRETSELVHYAVPARTPSGEVLATTEEPTSADPAPESGNSAPETETPPGPPAAAAETPPD